MEATDLKIKMSEVKSCDEKEEVEMAEKVLKQEEVITMSIRENKNDSKEVINGVKKKSPSKNKERSVNCQFT